MKVAVVYIYPMTGEPHHDAYAVRFLATYNKFKTDVEHQFVVVCNGGSPNNEVRSMFGCCQNLTLLEHDDSGWDNGGHQLAASRIPADLMLFLGGTAYIRGAGWLNRVVDSFKKHGDGIYGAMGNMGVPQYSVSAHIRTTGYWLPPKLMNEYPVRVTTKEGRYPFEHGPNCITQWVRSKGLKTMVVTWFGEYPFPEWGSIPNGFQSGNQSSLIFGDRLTEPPYYGHP